MENTLKSFKEFLKEQEETFTPPANVSRAAQKALDFREEHGRDEVSAGTRVGWTRANQLANREKISKETVKRMYSFFSRHKGNEKISDEYKDEPWKDNGYVSWLLWGGDAGYEWVKDVLNEEIAINSQNTIGEYNEKL